MSGRETPRFFGVTAAAWPVASEIIVGEEAHVHDHRPAIPEQILTESVTDIDATEAGEADLVLNTQSLRARSGGAHIYASVLELEWRVLRDLRLRLEPSYASTQDSARARSRVRPERSDVRLVAP